MKLSLQGLTKVSGGTRSSGIRQVSAGINAQLCLLSGGLPAICISASQRVKPGGISLCHANVPIISCSFAMSLLNWQREEDEKKI